MVVAKTLDHTKAEEQHSSLKCIARRDFLHGVSAILVKSILQNIVNVIVKKSRLTLVAERIVRERERTTPTMGIVRQGGQSGRSPNALSYEELGSCAYILTEANMGLAQEHK